MGKDLFNRINASLENISLQVVTLEPEDIPAMGVLLNDLTQLEENAAVLQDPIFPRITAGLKGYCERLVLCETTEMVPVESFRPKKEDCFTVEGKGESSSCPAVN